MNLLAVCHTRDSRSSPSRLRVEALQRVNARKSFTGMTAKGLCGCCLTL
jgi:hypothetical protein